MGNLPSFLLAFLVTSLTIWLLKPVAHVVGLVDKPGGRKKHQGDVPLIGGPSMFAGLLAASATLSDPVPGLGSLLGAAGLLMAVGVIDDRFNLSPLGRFIAQITAALIVAFSGHAILTDLGNLFSDGRNLLGTWATPFTVLAIVGVVNAMNMSDGMDGSSGSLALVALVSMTVLGWLGGLNGELYLLICVVAIVAAFLAFNLRTPWRSHAQIFMGDGGSMFLGVVLAWFFIHLTQGETRVMTPVTALWIFALPLLDTVCIMLRRVLKGRSPFAPDREHLHHILLAAGYSVNQTLAVMLAFAVTLAAIGVLGFTFEIPESAMFFGFLILFVLYFWAMSRAWRVMRAIKPANKSSGGSPHGVIRTIKSSEE